MGTIGEPTKADVSACDREPIHVPGSIRPHGALLVLDGDLAVLQAGANLEAIVGVSAGEALGQPFGARPRTSFATWRETVRDRSLAWKPSEVETAGELRNAGVDFWHCDLPFDVLK